MSYDEMQCASDAAGSFPESTYPCLIHHPQHHNHKQIPVRDVHSESPASRIHRPFIFIFRNKGGSIIRPCSSPQVRHPVSASGRFECVIRSPRDDLQDLNYQRCLVQMMRIGFLSGDRGTGRSVVLSAHATGSWRCIRVSQGQQCCAYMVTAEGVWTSQSLASPLDAEVRNASSFMPNGLLRGVTLGRQSVSWRRSCRTTGLAWIGGTDAALGRIDSKKCLAFVGLREDLSLVVGL